VSSQRFWRCHEKAQEFADRALALDPNMFEAHLHKAAAAKALGKTEVVREASEKLAAIGVDKFRRVRRTVPLQLKMGLKRSYIVSY
jgi:hypothetical protein